MELQRIFQQAIAAQDRGDLAQAESCFRRILDIEPRNPQVLHPLGVVKARLGQAEEAAALIGQALSLHPDAPEMLLDYGVVLRVAGRDAEALAAFDRAVELQPGNLNLARLRADLLMRLDCPARALADFDRLLAFRPATAQLLHAKGQALQGLKRHAEAAEIFARALAQQPGLKVALYARGSALAAEHRIAEWFDQFARFAAQSGGASAWSQDREKDPALDKQRHDAEQAAWRSQAGLAPVGEALCIEHGARLAGPAVNPANVLSVSRAWRDSRPQLVVVDDLLTEAGLAALRRFCWASTVWRTPYENGYLGAFPETGFAAPLLAQIAEEFRAVFSEICGDHALKYAWGFKYDSALAGIGIHADQAAVNVNFWITPDDANLDAGSGGLVVWDVAAPLDWDFEKFNRDQDAMRDFLAANGAKSVTIPHRANRAVIFDSDLFHQTDTIRFREGYQNRRINITLLYGERDPARR